MSIKTESVVRSSNDKIVYFVDVEFFVSNEVAK